MPAARTTRDRVAVVGAGAALGEHPMAERNIVVTEEETDRLRGLLDPDAWSWRDRHQLEVLEHELDRAETVPAEAIPADAVTMGSQVRVRDLDSDVCTVYTLVYPHEASLEQSKISILAPIGTALLGYREGDVITWTVPGGVRRLRVEKVLYQPEAARASDTPGRRARRRSLARAG